MFDSVVKKIIARMGEREVVMSSYDEMQAFIEGGTRPDFSDDTIVCIKFLVLSGESPEDAEETSWYINELYAEESLNFTPAEEDLFETPNVKMAAEFLPELLPLLSIYPGTNILERYSEFRLYLFSQGRGNIIDSEKLAEFITWMKENDYI